MAALDYGERAVVHNVTSIVLSDGAAATLTLLLRQGIAGWTETPRTVAEARNAGRHASTPIVNETEDNNVTGSVQAIVTTFIGNTNHSLRDFVSQRGTATGLTSTANGTGYCFQMVMTFTHSDGTTQTATFAYCRADTLEFTETEGQYTINMSWTDFEREPTYA